MNVENSVIKHYKKQLIHRQHDEPNNNNKFEEVTNTKIYDLEGEKKRNDLSVEKKTNELSVEKKTRRKRKNKNCRGQFRHEGMELIKLGTNQSQSLCKTSAPPKNLPATSVIQPPILEQPQYAHALPQMVPERRNSRELQSRVPLIYRSPPQPEYRVPYHLPPYPHPPPTLPYRPTPTLPPPPYPVARSPPRPVPRSPPTSLLRPQPYSGIHFQFARNPPPPEKKRKVEEKIVAAIDLTVDNKNVEKRHKCQCECGKRMTQEVIISVKEKDKTVPSTYLKGKLVNGKLQFDQGEENSNRLQNGVAKVPEKEKLPQLFLIDDLLAKGVRLEQKRPKILEKPDNRVIITPANPIDVSKPKMKDHTISSMINTRRQSADVDTISISSSGSEPLRSPRSLEKQIPHGKLYYYKNNNSFIRYFDDTQKKLFIDNITSDGKHDRTVEEKEIIELPKDTIFNSKDNLTVEEYVSEMTLVEKYIPKDFFNFYKFVTGYQIYNNNLPVSFLTFLKVYNTNGLKLLLQRYVHSLKQNGEACN